MTVAFIGWVVFVFAVSDLVGGALRERWFGAAASSADHRPARPGSRLADVARSALLGFAALWVALSVAYAVGVATRGVMAGVVVASGAAAAVAQRRRLAAWVRARLIAWAVIGAVALLASCVTPTFNTYDDPEYFYLISKLLHTGSIVEYFNYRRPITLGGWTFIQAIFSSGPAGTACVASVDAVVGGVFFLFGAALLDADRWTALPAALLAVVLLQGFQQNLGTAIAMGATGAVLIGLCLSASDSAADLTTIAFAIMALTIRPQLGLVAMTAAAVACLSRRARWYRPAGAAVALAGIWTAIFVRDTSLLPLSLSPGYNPRTDGLYDDPSAGPRSLAWQLAYIAEHHWRLVGVVVFALAVCVWQSLARTRSARERRHARILAAFVLAAVATVVVLDAVIGTRAWAYARYHLPIVEGVLYMVFVGGIVRVFRRETLARHAWMSGAAMAGALAVAIGGAMKKLSVPAASSASICTQLLTPSEQRAVEQLPAARGDTLLGLDCPVGSFVWSPHVMMNNLFFVTRGDDVDISSTPGDILKWLHAENIGRLVYLERDRGFTFAFDFLRRWVESRPPTTQRWSMLKYELDGLGVVRELARDCPSVRLPIVNPQGPLVIVEVGQCAGRGASRPAAIPAPQGPSEP